MPALLDLMKAVGKEPVAYRIHADALDYTYTSFIRPGQLPQAGVLYICSDGIPAGRGAVYMLGRHSRSLRVLLVLRAHRPG